MFLEKHEADQFLPFRFFRSHPQNSIIQLDVFKLFQSNLIQTLFVEILNSVTALLTKCLCAFYYQTRSVITFSAGKIKRFGSTVSTLFDCTRYIEQQKTFSNHFVKLSILIEINYQRFW